MTIPPSPPPLLTKSPPKREGDVSNLPVSPKKREKHLSPPPAPQNDLTVGAKLPTFQIAGRAQQEESFMPNFTAFLKKEESKWKEEETNDYFCPDFWKEINRSLLLDIKESSSRVVSAYLSNLLALLNQFSQEEIKQRTYYPIFQSEFWTSFIYYHLTLDERQSIEDSPCDLYNSIVSLLHKERNYSKNQDNDFSSPLTSSQFSHEKEFLKKMNLREELCNLLKERTQKHTSSRYLDGFFKFSTLIFTGTNKKITLSLSPTFIHNLKNGIFHSLTKEMGSSEEFNLELDTTVIEKAPNIFRTYLADSTEGESAQNQAVFYIFSSTIHKKHFLLTHLKNFLSKEELFDSENKLIKEKCDKSECFQRIKSAVEENGVLLLSSSIDLGSDNNLYPDINTFLKEHPKARLLLNGIFETLQEEGKLNISEAIWPRLHSFLQNGE